MSTVHTLRPDTFADALQSSKDGGKCAYAVINPTLHPCSSVLNTSLDISEDFHSLGLARHLLRCDRRAAVKAEKTRSKYDSQIPPFPTSDRSLSVNLVATPTVPAPTATATIMMATHAWLSNRSTLAQPRTSLLTLCSITPHR